MATPPPSSSTPSSSSSKSLSATERLFMERMRAMQENESRKAQNLARERLHSDFGDPTARPKYEFRANVITPASQPTEPSVSGLTPTSNEYSTPAPFQAVSYHEQQGMGDSNFRARASSSQAEALQSSGGLNTDQNLSPPPLPYYSAQRRQIFEPGEFSTVASDSFFPPDADYYRREARTLTLLERSDSEVMREYEYTMMGEAADALFEAARERPPPPPPPQPVATTRLARTPPPPPPVQANIYPRAYDRPFHTPSPSSVSISPMSQPSTESPSSRVESDHMEAMDDFQASPSRPPRHVDSLDPELANLLRQQEDILKRSHQRMSQRSTQSTAQRVPPPPPRLQPTASTTQMSNPYLRASGVPTMNEQFGSVISFSPRPLFLTPSPAPTTFPLVIRHYEQVRYLAIRVVNEAVNSVIMHGHTNFTKKSRVINIMDYSLLQAGIDGMIIPNAEHYAWFVKRLRKTIAPAFYIKRLGSGHVSIDIHDYGVWIKRNPCLKKKILSVRIRSIFNESTKKLLYNQNA